MRTEIEREYLLNSISPEITTVELVNEIAKRLCSKKLPFILNVGTDVDDENGSYYCRVGGEILHVCDMLSIAIVDKTEHDLNRALILADMIEECVVSRCENI